MKRFLSLVLMAAMLASTAIAGGQGGYVHGYTKSNGTYVQGYYRAGSSSLSTPSLPSYTSPTPTYNYFTPPATTYQVPKTSSYSTWSVPKSTYRTPTYDSTPKSTYNLGGTAYIYGQTYQNGRPKVERSESAKQQLLKSYGYTSTPTGYEIDHIVPLHWGGTDTPANMQLLTKEQHAKKTALERKIDASTPKH